MIHDPGEDVPDDNGGALDDGNAAAEAEYVTVATVHGPSDEGVICAFLESMGVPARARGEVIRKIHGITVDGIGAAEIEVPAQFAETARELLAMADRGELRIGDDFDVGS